MAWDTSPKVATARDIGKSYGADKVIVLLIDEEAGTMEAISYGKNKAECAAAKRLSDIAYDAIFDALRPLP